MLVRGLSHKRFVDLRIEALTLGADRTQAFLRKDIYELVALKIRWSSQAMSIRFHPPIP